MVTSTKVRRADLESISNLNVLTDRLKKLKKEWEEAPVIVTPQVSLSFTKSYKETEGLPETLRLAMAFDRIVEETPILIRDSELIVGSLTGYIRGVDVLSAEAPRQIIQAIDNDAFDRKMSDWESAKISPEDAKLLREDAEYWEKRLPPNFVNEALKRELGEEHMDLLMDRAMVFEGIPMRADTDIDMSIWGPFAYTYISRGMTLYREKVVPKGLNHIIALAKAELEKMEKKGEYSPTMSPRPMEKRILLKAMILSCQAVIKWAHRHAELARELAGKESNQARKKELEEIAERCDWVPANPPRSFAECLQSVRFLHAAPQKQFVFRKETSLGRLDQTLYPYYKEDIENGKITRQEAIELLGCLWLKTREGESFDPEKKEGRHSQGTLLPDVTICGRDERGRDATNEVSYLILEVMRQMKLSEPAVYIRYHDGMKDEFLVYALQCNLDYRGGNPAFLNDELGTRRYLERGVALKDASDWLASGCLGYHLDCGQHVGGFMHLNQAKILELTLYNGFDPRTQKQLGPKTGDVTQFTSIDQFYEAFLKQEDYFADKLRKDYQIRRSLELKCPISGDGLNAAMWYEYTIPTGLMPMKGAAPYPITSTMWIGDRGITDVADVLAAIRYLVFEQKKLTMAELLEVMKTNWEGYEEVRQMCLNAPKYGNDDDYVDDIFQYMTEKTQEIMQSRPDPFLGQKPFLFKGAAAGHIVHGLAIGAMPNGREAGTPINDGATSAMPGRDVKGPTALINSATKASTWELTGCVHNMKFTKAVLNTPEKLEKVLALVKTFFERGGWHIQFNIHSVEELLEAKKHPEQYRNLLVRVGGYSAYFVDLPPSLQDEIIARTFHEV